MLKHKIAGRPLPVILFTIFVDLIGFGIIIPIIPQLLANPASEFYLLGSGQTLQQGYILLGYLTAVFSIAQFLAAPILGQLSDRSKNFGMMGAAFGLGFIIGPYLGGKLSDPTVVSWFSPATPFWFAAILALLNVGSLLLILPETNKHI